MANKNSALNTAKNAKADEFYTQLEDIENELKHYRKHFKGKVVLCNCDDPYESNFFKYFAMNFNKLGLKKLVTTCYKESAIADTQLSLFDDPETPEIEKPPAFKLEIGEVQDFNGDGAINIYDVEWLIRNDSNVLTPLKGDGDFRSAECVEMLKEADIVCTNPPWSLLKEYVPFLVDHGKDFLILCNKNSITYKEIFPLFKEGKVWIGPSIHSGGRKFRVPEHYDKAKKYTRDKDGNKLVDFPGPRWFTNLEHAHHYEDLPLWRSYNEQDYPRYLNLDAINVGETKDIPCDYAGLMGVPITFMDKYNPKQFEIVGCAECREDAIALGVGPIGAQWLEDYRKEGGTGHYTANMRSLVFYDKDGKAQHAFKRIIVRNRYPEAEE